MSLPSQPSIFILGCYTSKLTPAHHRIHHARNPQYIDTNYCNLLNIWDKVFGTYQDVMEEIEIDYGITRKINSGNFLDVYFGDIVALAKDIMKAPGLKNKVIFGMSGYGGNTVIIDMENSRIVVLNSIHWSNKKYKYN